MTYALPNCSYAKVHIWQDTSGAWWETFYIPEAVTGANNPVALDNQIGRPAGRTQTPPGEVLENKGFCLYPPPATAATASVPTPINAQVATAPEGAGGGAILLVLALIGSAGYAFFQQRNSKGDFADDYHPMSDAPLLPPVATDENLDIVYERVSHPRYQNISEPSPWESNQVYPRSQAASPSAPITTSSPVITSGSAVMRSGFIPGDEAGDDLKAEARAQFELHVLPAPRNGYDLSEENLLNKGKAYWLVWQAVQLDYSKNWMCQNLFKIPKGGTGSKYKLLGDLIDRVKRDLP